MRKQYLEIPDAVRKAWPLHPEALVQTACRFCAEISLQSGDACVNAKRLLACWPLNRNAALFCGSRPTVRMKNRQGKPSVCFSAVRGLYQKRTKETRN